MSEPVPVGHSDGRTQAPGLLSGAPSQRPRSEQTQPARGTGRGDRRASGALVAAPEAGALHPQPPLSARPMALSRLPPLLWAPIKFFWGMVFCQSVLGALAVVGWTYRLMQRTALKQWYKLSTSADKAANFGVFAATDSRTAGHLDWPNWFLAQNFRRSIRRGFGRSQGPDGSEPTLPVPVISCAVQRPEEGGGVTGAPVVWGLLMEALFASLWANVRLGVQGVFNTWVLTLPACVFMWFGWYDGWNNSFNKGYEQFWVGPAVSSLGILLFIAAMFYLPMAQARQAVSGSWRSFYQFPLLWTLVRRHWLACFGLASLYALCSVPMLVLASVVTFLPNLHPNLADLPESGTVQVLNRYYFWSALFVFPAFVLLRVVAARIYGSALLKALQAEAIAPEALSDTEWQAFNRLGLLRVEPRRIRHPALRLVVWAGTRVGRITFGSLTALVWFVVAFQTFVAQFFHYHLGPTVWLNRPLVQLPWFHHLPATLKNPWSDFIGAALVVALAWWLRRLVLRVGSRRRR